MRILLAHTSYKLPGGEDRVFADESALLRRNGHEVVEYRQHNEQTDRMSWPRMAARTIWSGSTYSELRALLRTRRPDICHFHNTFPVMSPAVFYAAKAERIPVIATLHNYRLLCPAATLLRDGAPCESCMSSLGAWNAVRYGCYRGSRCASAVAAAMLTAHRAARTWTRAVDVWIALTEFARRKFVQGGLPAERVVVKPNFVAPDPGYSEIRENFTLFAGRLSAEKGVETLLSAWRAVSLPIPLSIVGDGPLKGTVEQASRRDPRIRYLGQLSSEGLRDQMKRARVLVFPSIWYEGLPLTVLEAFATGLPVLASNLGSMTRLVAPGTTGLHFEPGNAAALASKLTWCQENPERMMEMGRQARSQYLASYSANSNYEQMMRIYELALHNSQRRQSGRQSDWSDGDAVVDHISAADGSPGRSAAGSGTEAGECVALNDRAIHCAGGVTKETHAVGKQ
jgi:glycosyltransferase involved in cell wall biosynthesis